MPPTNESATGELTAQEAAGSEAFQSGGFPLPFDPFRLAAAALRRWYWPLIAGVIFAAIGIGVGLKLFKKSYTAEIQLIRRGTDSGFRATQFGNAFKPGELKVETLVPLMYSVNLIAKVAAQADPPITAKAMIGALEVTPERRTELIRVAFSTKTSAEEAARLVNLYGHEVVQLTKDLQRQEARETSAFLNVELAGLNRQLDQINTEILQFSREETYIDGDKETEAYLRDLGNMEINLQEARIEEQAIKMRITNLRDALRKHNPVATELRSAQEKLTSLLVQYTEQNPLVIEQQEHINKLSKQLESYESPDTDDSAFTGGQISDAIYLDLVNLKSSADTLSNKIAAWEGVKDQLREKLERIPGKNLNYARLQARKATFVEMQDLIGARQTEAEVYEKNAMGYYRLFAETTPNSVLISGRGTKVLVVGIAFGGVAFGLVGLFILLLELADRRILTAHDLTRVTGLPVSGKLPASYPVKGPEMERWALKQIADLQKSLGLQQQDSKEIGFISPQAGEGKTLIIRTLAQSLAQREQRVVCLINRSDENTEPQIDIGEALNQPEKIVEYFASTETHNLVPFTIIVPDAFEWTPAHRQEWQKLKKQWEGIGGLTTLVEIHSELSTQNIVFAEGIAHLVWISSSGTQTGAEIDDVTSVLEHTKCQIETAILNRSPNLFQGVPLVGRWAGSKLATLAALGTLFSAVPSQADGAVEAPPTLNAFSTSTQSQKSHHRPAKWQQRLTLGPGDTVDIGLYGYPNHLRKNVIVSPDGKISYLQARNITAQGLTVDELRNALDEALKVYFRSPRTMIMPKEFRSKRYHIMGSVKRSGSYIMNRPVTVIEAVAQAEGMRTGLFDHNTIELADLERSFLVRGSKRMEVDFKKLFHQGDLTQNILLEPDDYIYIPNSSANEVYLLGAVMRPGAIGITTDATVLRLIAVRAGFLKTAYKDRILIIRGSWVEPETIVFDAAAVFRGEAKDFLLRPKDVVFISEKPWTYAAELLDLAARSYLQSATATWTGENVGPLITKPFLD